MSTFLRRYLTNRGAALGLILLVAVILVAIFAPLWFPRSPWTMVGRPLLKPFINAQFPLGTDMLGRDIASGLVWGARASLIIGAVSTLIAVVVGILLGALAGFYGGWVDEAAMRFTEFFQTIPQFAMAIVLVAIFSPTITSITLAIGVVSWPPVARLVRGEFLSLRSRDFVQAAVVAGQGPLRIIFTQILPNALSPIVVMASLMIATAILTESGLAFLGLGDPNVMSWGFMIGAARTMLNQAPWMSVMPGLAILFTVLAINLIGEGLNDAMNPYTRRQEG